jgi:hypothetical protein
MLLLVNLVGEGGYLIAKWGEPPSSELSMMGFDQKFTNKNYSSFSTHFCFFAGKVSKDPQQKKIPYKSIEF